MKLVSFLILLFVSIQALNAQIIDPEEAAKRKAENRTNQKIDRGIDKAFDKAEDGVMSLFKKKDKTGDEATKENDNEGSTSSETTEEALGAETSKGLVAYSKYDFIPGELVVAFDDFSQDEVGDFPAKWNSGTSGEVVTIDGREGKWLNISQNGVFYPEFIGAIPENSTLEMELGFSGNFSVNGYGLIFKFIADRPNLLRYEHSDLEGKVEVQLHPANKATNITCFDLGRKPKMSNRNAQSQWTAEDPIAKVSIWRQKTRIRVYLNEEKIWDIPRAFEPGINYRLVFDRNFNGDGSLYMGNVRLAEGKPDTRSKLITEGRFVTRGITFDVGSAKIKPESYPVIKEIADALQANPDVKINIIGHTDSDGNPASNLELSKKRAASVAEALQKDFSIDSGRLKTDGQGDAEPSEPNTTPSGKANNRRVEFIKV